MTESEVTPEKLKQADPWYWAYREQIKLQSGLFTMVGHEYQIGVMQSEAKIRVLKKGAQIGMTWSQVLCVMHGMIFGHYPVGVLYLFPNEDSVSRFSKSTFGPLVRDNYNSIGKHIRDTNAVDIKQIRGAMLFFAGARSTQRVGGVKKDSPALRQIAVDKIVYDEVDLMEPEMVEMARQRMSHSTIKEEVFLSTPTIPDYGIDKMWQNSNQMLWIIKCSKCGRDCCLELDFPECVKYRMDGRAYRACPKCGGEVYPRDGQWIEQIKGAEIEGRWISQLNSIYIDPGSILRAFETPPNGNIQEVYNSMLGMAWIAAENRLTQEAVLRCCSTHVMSQTDRGPCAMGVDVGKTLHVIVGKKISGGVKKIIWMGELKEFEELYDVASRLNVKHTCIDFQPETRKARDYQISAGHTVYLVRYKEQIVGGERVDQEAGVIDLARTEICDATHKAITEHQYSLPRRSSVINEYAKQMSNTAKILEEDDKGRKIYRYRKLGADHYRHAMNYLDVALQTLPESIEDPIMAMRKRIEEELGVGSEGNYNPLTYGLM